MYKKCFKRCLDFLLSLCGIIVLSPVLLTLCILVRVKLGSPVLFHQERPGRHEKIFKLYKFRSMTDEKDADGNLLPDEVLHRKKSPYPKTYDPEYEYLLKSRMLDILSSPNEPIHAIIDKEKVISFMNTASDYGRPWYGQLMAGPQMIAYMLQVNYWMKKYNIK